MSSQTVRSGASVVADMLDGYGVSHVFMVPAVLRRTFAELERRHPGIARIAAHGEKSAVYMADGYARASGRPGVCAAQVIGALNLAAGLREPYLAASPVVAFTGGRLPATKFRQVYQEVDDMPAFEPVTKFNGSIDDAARFPDMIRHLFRVATTGCPGPVHLQVQGNEGQLDTAEAEAEPLVEAQFAAVPPFRPQPDPDSIAAALRLLQRARRPVIVAGGGVRASRAGTDLVRLAEIGSIPVATSANGKDTIPGTHPLCVGVVGSYSRESANLVVGRADLVCFIGTRTGGMTTHFWAVPPIGTPAIQIDIEPQHLGRNYPLQAAVLGDARSALRALAAAAADQPRPERGGWLAEVAEIKQQWRDKYLDVMTSDGVPVRPERICAELTAFLPSDAIVLADTGHAGMWMGQFFDTTSAGQGYLRSAGHLGWAFPAGMGAKAGAPDRPVFVFTGDAGLYYHLGEVETAVRRGLNSITVVNNNRSGNQSKRGFDRAYGGSSTDQAREMWTYRDVRFATIAEEMGALGLTVDKPAELAPAFERAIQAGRPVVIDVRTDIDVVAPLPVT